MSQTQRPNREDALQAGSAGPAAPAGRKRVIARELGPDQAPPRDSAGPLQGALVPAPPPVDLSDAILVIPEGADHRPREVDPTPVVDPTMLGRRHRRHTHHRIYRWTQALTMLCGGAAAASVICTMTDETLAGRILAGCGLFLGLVATVLSGRTSLSRRWRGWAVAATVFAASALALTWIHAAITEDEREGAPVPKVKRG